MEMTEEMKRGIREYNRQRYRSNPKHTFMVEIRSHKKKLEALGFTVIPPDEQTLDQAIETYLQNRKSKTRRI